MSSVNRAKSEEPRYSEEFSEIPSILVFCGPSGIGKSTLISRLMSDFPGRFGFSVSHTTRSIRPGEINGVHYHFVPKDRMEMEIAQGKFLEHAVVHGNIYGTSFDSVRAVQETHKICVLDVDVQGVDNVKRSPFLDQGRMVFVMLVPPSIEALEQRLRARNTDSEETIQRRLINAKQELEYQYKPGNYWDAVIVNDDFERCYGEFVETIVKRFFRINPMIGTLSVRKLSQAD